MFLRMRRAPCRQQQHTYVLCSCSTNALTTSGPGTATQLQVSWALPCSASGEATSLSAIALEHDMTSETFNQHGRGCKDLT